MQRQLAKMDLLYRTPGARIWATEEARVALMEWDRPEAGRLAWHLQQLLRRHALSTNCLDQLSDRTLVVKRLEPLGLAVVVGSHAHEAALTFAGSLGEILSRQEVLALPHLSPSKLDYLQDTSIHAARSIRAHLHREGDLTLRLTFGIGPEGECCLQVPDPVECDFGSSDYEALCTQLGGDPS